MAIGSSRHLALLLSVGLCVGLATPNASAQLDPRTLKRQKDKPSQPQNSPGDQQVDPMSPVPITESIVDRVIKLEETKELVVDVMLRVDGYSYKILTTDRPAAPLTPNGTAPVVPTQLLKFQTAAVIFPLPPDTASSVSGGTEGADFKADLQFDGKTVAQTPVIIDGYGGGQRYLKFTAKDLEANSMVLKLSLPATCGKVRFDEQLAMSVPWPTGTLPPAAQSCFGMQLGIDYIHDIPRTYEQQRDATNKLIDERIKEWTGGEDPKKIYPAYLAKFLMGKLVETLQPTGEGFAFNRNASVQGFNLKGVEATLLEGRGSEFDLISALCAVYRRVGIPARIVLGWDRLGDSNISKREKFRGWVEFCLIDPITKKDVWIPVDIVKQRKSSSRAPDLARRWEYFGGIADYQQVVPLSFHFHPPTTVSNVGQPMLWGWLTTPESLLGIQTITLNGRAGTNRGGTPPKDTNKPGRTK